MDISVIGLGKLGSPLCAVLASAGHTVIGVDLDQAKVDAINAHHAPVNEPGLENLIRTFGDNFRATTSLEDAVKHSDVTFIVVATPSQENGIFSLKYVLPVCQQIGRVLATKSKYHTTVLVSTVMPGHTAEVTKEMENTSGKKAGVGFGVCYSPEFIALGSVIRDMRNPDMILIGTDHEKAFSILENILVRMVANLPRVVRMKPIEAELTKIAINTFVTTKIAYANMLADLCEKLPGASVDTVTRAVGLDSRIGSKYLKGGVSFGGPCFPRDNVALRALGESLNVDVVLPREVHNSNMRRINTFVEWVASRALGRVVAVVGLTYKLGSEITEESAGWKVMQSLLSHYVEVSAYDPLFTGPLLPSVRRVSNLRQCIEDADMVLVMLPYPEAISLDAVAWARTAEQRHGHSGADRMVVDCWRVLPHLAGCIGVEYIPIGTGK
jgi:UDPglucose 6-dehydrogenase